MKRAERRQAERNKKAKVKKFIKEQWLMPSNGYANKFKEKMLDSQFVGKVASAPKSCNGKCCANPRRIYRGKSKLTMQELRHEE